MMPQHHRYFDRNGREVAAHEAMRGNILRDGFSIRIPTTLRDSRFRDARQLWDSGQLVVSDSDLTGSSGNRPGFRVSDSPINQEIADARAQYLHDLQNAWRNPLRLGDAAPPPDPDEAEDDMPNGELEQMTAPASDRRMVDVDATAANHRRNMQRLYDAHARELSEAWRKR